MQINTSVVSLFFLIDYVDDAPFFELVSNILLYLDLILPISLVDRYEFPTANLDIPILVSTINKKQHRLWAI